MKILFLLHETGITFGKDIDVYKRQALLCNMLMVVPGSNTILPLNAVTPMLGAPVIIYVIVNRKNIQYFN